MVWLGFGGVLGLLGFFVLLSIDRDSALILLGLVDYAEFVVCCCWVVSLLVFCFCIWVFGLLDCFRCLLEWVGYLSWF